jgi:hypothetical protein
VRYILIFWALPLGFFWGWFGLSYYDINFGFAFLSRPAHDFVFNVYGAILGISPSTIPPLVAKACVVDTAIIFAIFGYRRRERIRSWWRDRRAPVGTTPAAIAEGGPALPAE